MTQPRAWALEQNDGRIRYVSTSSATLFAESRSFGVTRHTQPVGKVVVARSGFVEVGLRPGVLVRAAGVIVPAQVAHTCRVSGDYLALLLRPGDLAPLPGPIGLPAGVAERIAQALPAEGEVDLDAARRQVVMTVGAGAPLDPRITQVLDMIADVNSARPIGALADDVGLSPSHLRTLVHQSLGVPLARLRLWERLLTAMGELPTTSAATVAAEAGFADQAHLTRTARRLVGRTPSQFVRSTAAAR